MTLANPLPFGLREIWVYPIDNTGAVGTGVALPNAMTLTFSEAETFAQLKASDRVIAEHGDGPLVDWKFEAGGLPLSVLSIITGGALISSGTTPAQVNTFTKLNTDARPYFQIQGRAISDSGGDVVCALFRCKADASIEGEFQQGAFFLSNLTGKAFGDPTTGKLYVFKQSETPGALSSTAIA